MVDRGAGVESFSYTEEVVEALEASLSRERLGARLDAAGGDRAIRLHAWSTAVGAALMTSH